MKRIETIFCETKLSEKKQIIVMLFDSVFLRRFNETYTMFAPKVLEFNNKILYLEKENNK